MACLTDIWCITVLAIDSINYIWFGILEESSFFWILINLFSLFMLIYANLIVELFLKKFLYFSERMKEMVKKFCFISSLMWLSSTGWLTILIRHSNLQCNLLLMFEKIIFNRYPLFNKMMIILLKFFGWKNRCDKKKSSVYQVCYCTNF